MTSFEDLVNHIDQPGIAYDPALDIIRLKPDITQDEALAVQLAVKRRRVAEGDRIIGHQASFTSPGVRVMFPDAPRPMVGTMLASQMRADGDEVPLDGDEMFIESEMALILGRDLEGPSLSPTEVLAAIDCFLPAIEVAPLAPGVREKAYSWPHMIAVQKDSAGFVVLGSVLTSAKGFDPAIEGCVIGVDGIRRASATGFEVMGSPLNVVAAIAARLHAIGGKLEAGQLIITGSMAPPQLIGRASRDARLEFQTLGNVSVRIRADEPCGIGA